MQLSELWSMLFRASLRAYRCSWSDRPSSPCLPSPTWQVITDPPTMVPPVSVDWFPRIHDSCLTTLFYNYTLPDTFYHHVVFYRAGLLYHPVWFYRPVLFYHRVSFYHTVLFYHPVLFYHLVVFYHHVLIYHPVFIYHPVLFQQPRLALLPCADIDPVQISIYQVWGMINKQKQQSPWIHDLVINKCLSSYVEPCVQIPTFIWFGDALTGRTDTHTHTRTHTHTDFSIRAYLADVR